MTPWWWTLRDPKHVAVYFRVLNLRVFYVFVSFIRTTSYIRCISRTLWRLLKDARWKSKDCLNKLCLTVFYLYILWLLLPFIAYYWSTHFFSFSGPSSQRLSLFWLSFPEQLFTVLFSVFVFSRCNGWRL
jgi:hypothetical protein